QPERLSYGAEHYKPRSPDTSTVLHKLFEGYEREGITMPYTMADFRRDYAKEHFKDMTVLQQLAYLSTVTPAVRRTILADLSPTHRRKLQKPMLTTEVRDVLRDLLSEWPQSLPVDEILEALPRDEIEKFL